MRLAFPWRAGMLRRACDLVRPGESPAPVRGSLQPRTITAAQLGGPSSFVASRIERPESSGSARIASTPRGKSGGSNRLPALTGTFVQSEIRHAALNSAAIGKGCHCPSEARIEFPERRFPNESQNSAGGSAARASFQSKVFPEDVPAFDHERPQAGGLPFGLRERGGLRGTRGACPVVSLLLEDARLPAGSRCEPAREFGELPGPAAGSGVGENLKFRERFSDGSSGSVRNRFHDGSSGSVSTVAARPSPACGPQGTVVGPGERTYPMIRKYRYLFDSSPEE